MNWDVFHTDSLEGRKGLSTDEVRAALARGELREDDLARPAGTSEGWRRIGDVAALAGARPGDSKPPAAPAPPPKLGSREIPTAVLLDDLDGIRAAGPTPPSVVPVAREDRREVRQQSEQIAREAEERDRRDRERDRRAAKDRHRHRPPAPGAAAAGGDALPPEPPRRGAAEAEVAAAGAVAVAEGDDEFDGDPLSQDEEVAEFTLAPRGGLAKEEDLDLAAMVDVAFQLIMFFLVTASSVFFKSMEIPPPKMDKEKTGQQAAVARTLEDLSNENILVEIDTQGQLLVNHKPVAPENLVAEMRRVRADSGMTTMLLMADLATPHRNAVLAYDAANEVGLEIRIAKPAAEPPPE